MDHSQEPNVSIYDFSDKSIPRAGYAAIVYAMLSLFTALVEWIHYYHGPVGGSQNHDLPAEQYLDQMVLGVIVAAIAGALAFGIFRHSRFAVVAMLVLVIVIQLYGWFAVHSLAGTLVSIVVVCYLVPGVRGIFRDHAERKLQAQSV